MPLIDMGLLRASAVVVAMSAVPAHASEPTAVAFGAREGVEQLSLSPGGTKIAFIAPRDGQGSTLFTVSTTEPNATPRPALSVSGKPDRLARCRWVSDQRLVCTVWGMVKAPDTVRPLGYSRIVAVDADSANQKMLRTKAALALNASNYGGDIIDWLPGQDNDVLMMRFRSRTDQTGTIVGTRREGMSVERVDTKTLRSTPIEQPRPGIAEYITDGRGNVRIAGYLQYAGETGQLKGTVRYNYRPKGSSDWKELGTLNTITEEGFNPFAVDADRNAVYGFRRKNGLRALYTRALDGSDREELVYARPDVDVDGLVRLGRDQRVVGFSYATDRREVVYLDKTLEALARSLGKALPGSPQVTILDATADESKLLIFAGSDDDPGVYYLYDKASRKLQPLMQKRPQLAGRTLAKVKPVTVPVGGGVSIPAYLTLPPGGAGKGLPAIVLPHGGPASRDEWGFDWLPQYFAARGYAVLQPNYRGSEGYGDDFQMENGFRSWRTAVGDVLASGRWLATEGIADPAKLAIVGWSFGGYAALQSAVLDPAVFKAVVAIAPVTDIALLKEQQRDWANSRVMAEYVGPSTAAASPAQNAARVKVPVLLAHGTLDSNVIYAQSTLMADKLRDAGGKVELLTYADLDHQLEDSAARAAMLEHADGFIRAAIGR